MGDFFKLPGTPWELPIRFLSVVGAFAIYLLTGLAAGALSHLFPPSLGAICWLNFLVTFFALCFLFFYCRTLPRAVSLGILRNQATPAHWAQDVKGGLYALLFAFPIFLAVSFGLELFIRFGLHIEELPDQLAVRFIKMTLGSPFYLVLTILSLALLVPLIEELLFRGFLQSWLRKRWGSRKAIVITALCFSFFHYSGAQGVSNILVIGSLLPIALFLSFIYEKQQSLLASFVLHSAFNTISIFNLFFFGG